MENVVILTSSDSDSDYSDTSSEENEVKENEVKGNENKIESLLNYNSEYEINKDNLNNLSSLFYNNSTYYNSLQRKISIIIDIKEDDINQRGLSNNAKFKVEFDEPFIIDSLSDIYLDTCMTMNCKFGNNQNNMALCVKIDQFKLDTVSASTNHNQNIKDALLITNENNDLDNHNEVVVHKGKQINYICSINPARLLKITGTVTNLAGEPIFYKNLRYVQISKLVRAIPQGTEITVKNDNTGFVGYSAVDHRKGVTDLYFYEETSGTTDHHTQTTYKFHGIPETYSSVVNTHIMGDYPRLILELLIIKVK